MFNRQIECGPYLSEKSFMSSNCYPHLQEVENDPMLTERDEHTFEKNGQLNAILGHSVTCIHTESIA